MSDPPSGAMPLAAVGFVSRYYRRRLAAGGNCRITWILMGSRREEFQESRRSLGIRRESSWQQETPDETVAVVYIEADDPGAAMAGMGSSDEPFDRWFRERVSDIYGIDLTEPSPPLIQTLDASF